jgi:hypothetical protein
MILHVECLPGLYGEMEPLAFHLGEQRIEVLHIADRWLSEDSSYFKINAADASTYILRHVHARQEWELTLYQAPDTHIT